MHGQESWRRGLEEPWQYVFYELRYSVPLKHQRDDRIFPERTTHQRTESQKQRRSRRKTGQGVWRAHEGDVAKQCCQHKSEWSQICAGVLGWKVFWLWAVGFIRTAQLPHRLHPLRRQLVEGRQIQGASWRWWRLVWRANGQDFLG